MTDNQLKLMQLSNYQAMPLGACERRTEMLIRQFYEEMDGQVYIALSGGKDSCVGADQIWSLYPDVPAVFCDTGNELESVKEHIQGMIDAGRPITIIKPDISFWEIVEKHGWPILSKNICMGINRFVNTKSLRQKILRINGGTNPTSGKKQQRTIPLKYRYILRLVLQGKLKVTSKCCGELKIKPFIKYERETGRRPYVFTMAADSKNRRDSFVKKGCNAFAGKKSESRPMMFWLESRVLEYIRNKYLPIAKAYCEKRGDVWYVQEQDESGEWHLCGDDRTGCKFCLFGIQFNPDRENRIQRLARVEPSAYREFIDHGGDKVMDILNIDWRVGE